MTKKHTAPAPVEAEVDDFDIPAAPAPVAPTAEPVAEAPAAAPAANGVKPLKVAEGQTIVYGNQQIAPSGSFFTPISEAERKECLDLEIAVEPEEFELKALGA